MSVDNDSAVRDSFEDALAWLIANRQVMRASLPKLDLVPTIVSARELDALKDENAELKAELERLREENSHTFPASLDERMSDYAPVADVAPDEDALTTDDLTEEVIQKLTQAKRKKWTELLNVELAELQQERSGPREDLAREAVCEKLLGLFARVGEL
jgi:type I site-specific restriction endonuclease